NLVFFKIVRSKAKFWQMLGRGTRLCPDLFGPGRNKAWFSVFDFCQNLEFFNQNPELVDPGIADSLSKRLFAARVELIAALDALHPVGSSEGMEELDASFDREPEGEAWSPARLRESLTRTLQDEVKGMSQDNFLVRAHRRGVEKFAKDEAWKRLT